ncbi:MAG: hypothetical protein JWQ27_308 [Ferruginibacter sp.]|nr:hypothetical protein [Ferruginibacter sp.]
MKKLFFIILAGSLISPALAQDKSVKQSKKEERRLRINAIAKQEEEGVIKYTKHTVVGGKFTSDGYGGFVEIGRAQSIQRSLLYQLEITERKHQKEEKQSLYNNTAPLIFGKINFLYPVKLGVQQQFLLGNKGNKNGVAITANVGGGVIAGLLRPYNVEIDSAGQRMFVNYQTDSAAYFNYANYIGGPNFGTGWKQVKVRPGIYLKPALRFDYGKYNEMVNALEVGLIAELYSKEIQQMIYSKPQKFFFSAYVSLMFGRRK